MTVLAVLLLLPAISLGRAMTYPGSASDSDRAVGWLRDHGGGGVVDSVENWWYTRNPPPTVGTPVDHLGVQRPSSITPAPIPATDRLPVVHLLPGSPRSEGTWQAVRRNGAGRPVLWTTTVSPDPTHPTVIAGVALMPRSTTALHMSGGTREPAPGLFAASRTRVPVPALGGLVAVFNAGWKVRDSLGGWYADGVSGAPLRNGVASLVIDSQGRASVTTWSSATVPPGNVVPTGVVDVRQNLHLIVQRGKDAPGLTSNSGQRWGSSHNQFQFTARSGIGTDAHGDLMYVAGQNLTLHSLATAMARAGVVTGMELDIHPNLVTFHSFASPVAVTDRQASPLLASMHAPASRYLVPDQRDFFYLTER